MTDAERALIERWRATRHPAYAAKLAELGSTVSLDTTSWKTALPTLERWATEPPDPRLVTLLLDWLLAPPFRSHPSRALWSTAFRILRDAEDPRVEPALPDPASFARLFPREDTGRQLAERLQTLIQSLPSPAPLDRAQETWLAGLTPPPRTLPELLQAVYTHPDDDLPRQVYADALSETGDPRGTFIALQLLPKRTREQTKAMNELLAEHKHAWMGPLATVLYRGDVVFERGFVAEAALESGGAGRDEELRRLVGHPAWRTLRALDVRGDQPHYDALLAHPVFYGLKSLTRVSPEALVGFEQPAPRSLQHLMVMAPLGPLRLPDLNHGAPALRHLAVWWTQRLDPIPPDVLALFQLPWFQRLDRFEVRFNAEHPGVLERWLLPLLALPGGPDARSARCAHDHRFRSGFDYDATRTGGGWHVVATYRHRTGRGDSFGELPDLIRRAGRSTTWEVKHPRYTPSEQDRARIDAAIRG